MGKPNNEFISFLNRWRYCKMEVTRSRKFIEKGLQPDGDSKW